MGLDFEFDRDSKQKIILKLPETGGMHIEHSWNNSDSNREMSHGNSKVCAFLDFEKSEREVGK